MNRCRNREPLDGTRTTTSNTDPNVVVLRKGTEGLPTDEYADAIRACAPELNVARADAERRAAVRPERTGRDGRAVDEGVLAEADELELFACAFSGLDHLPIDELKAHSVVVTNASGIHAPGIAEQVVGSMLVFARRLDEGI